MAITAILMIISIVKPTRSMILPAFILDLFLIGLMIFLQDDLFQNVNRPNL